MDVIIGELGFADKASSGSQRDVLVDALLAEHVVAGLEYVVLVPELAVGALEEFLNDVCTLSFWS